MSEPPLGARKDGTWYAMCTEPSITKTPVGPVQVPVPYQVISDLSTAMGTATNVRFNGNPAYLLDQSKMPKCMGDEQGTSGGIRSGMTSGEVKPTSGRNPITINGKFPIAAGDTCTLNKGNCKGQFIKAAPPSKGSVVSKRVKVQILLSQKELCPDHPIELTAMGTPKGGVFEWSCEGPCETVDESGKPKIDGEQIYLQLDKEEDTDSTQKSVSVSVEYTLNGEVAEDSKNLRIHPPLPLWMVWGLWIGKISSFTSGDDFGAKDDQQIVHKDPTNLFDFEDQPYALVVIPGMNMTYDEAFSMQAACNYTFRVHDSALIQNYTHGRAIMGDIAQSIGSEAFGAIDRNAKATADAIMKAIGEKKSVYVVAHSQGSEIFAKALKLLKYSLTGEEFNKIYYQGFGAETYIHNSYGLGDVRNVRTLGDPIPYAGSTAKGGVAALAVKDLMPSVVPNLINVIKTPELIENIRAFGNEQWEQVDSPVPFPHYIDCYVLGRHVRALETPDRHTFLTNYWRHVKIPKAGFGKPDFEPAEYKTYKDQAKEAIKKWSDEVAPKKNGVGFRVLGNAGRSKTAIVKRKQETVLALFFDGGGNTASPDSNISMMYRSLSQPGEKKDDSKTMTLAKYFSDTGIFEWRHWFGESEISTHTPLLPTFGGECKEITEGAYRYIVQEYVKLKKAGYAIPKIDLYGFGRGAAIANEVAWRLNDEGIQKKNKSSVAPPGSVKIRFMGLFDMFHALDGIDPQLVTGWHYNKLPSIIQHAAHALAEDETRVVLRPSIIQQSQVQSMVFPGRHNDVGGGKDNNRDIMKLSCSWIAEQASKAGVVYLEQFKLSTAEKAEIMNDPRRLMPGPEGLPNWGDVNPYYWEYRKNVTAGKEASQAAAVIKAAFATEGTSAAFQMQGMKNMGFARFSDKPDYVSEKRKFAKMARAVMRTSA